GCYESACYGPGHIPAVLHAPERMNKAENGSDYPEGRRETAKLLKECRSDFVPLVHVCHLYLEDLPDLCRLESVYGKLDCLLEKGILDRRELLFEAQEAVLARFLRKTVYELDQLLGIELLFEQYNLEELREVGQLTEGRRDGG